MADEVTYESYYQHAEKYFARRSLTGPSYLDRDRIAVLDDRSGTTQVALVDVATGDITPVTSFSERVQSALTNVATGRMVFGTDVGGNERQQLYALDTPTAEPRRLTTDDDAMHDPGVISKDGSYLLYRSNARDERIFDIVGQSLAGGESDMWLEDGGQVQAVAISEDGQSALVVRQNGNLDADVLLVRRGKDARNLTEHIGEQWIYGATFDRDESGAYVLSNANRDFVALMHLDIKSGDSTVVYDDDWDVEEFSLSPDGKRIALSVNDAGRSRAHIIAPDDADQPIVDLDLPDGVASHFSWSPDSSNVVFGFSTAESPSRILRSDLGGVVSTIAGEVEPNGPVTFAPDIVAYPSFDGLEVKAFFFKPEGEGPFPCLVDIHGGPESQRALNYAPSGPVLQYLTSLGMAVLSLNVRGSTGYGKEYAHLDDKGKRLDAVADAAAAVGYLTSRGDIDPDRIAVYGRSYGGYMTLACVTFHPDLWAAGVDVVGIADFVTFLERTGPWRRSHREAEYGSLEHDREMLERTSPMNSIDQITAPLQVFHGRNDPRVPVHEAEQIVSALKERGREVELTIFENEGHALSKLPNQLETFARMGMFLTKHLRLDPAQISSRAG